MPLTEIQKIQLENKQLFKANRQLLSENEQLRNALKGQLQSDPTYLNKLLEIRG